MRNAQIHDLETKLSSMETRCDKLESDLMGVQNGKDEQDQQDQQFKIASEGA